MELLQQLLLFFIASFFIFSLMKFVGVKRKGKVMSTQEYKIAGSIMVASGSVGMVIALLLYDRGGKVSDVFVMLIIGGVALAYGIYLLSASGTGNLKS